MVVEILGVGFLLYLVHSAAALARGEHPMRRRRSRRAAGDTSVGADTSGWGWGGGSDAGCDGGGDGGGGDGGCD